MSAHRPVILLAGAREAHALACGLSARNVPVLACQPEAPRGMPDLPVPLVTRRFQDDNSLGDWLSANDASAVIDASHPFDAAVSARAARVCAVSGIRYLRILRPGWVPQTGDRWTRFPDIASAAAAVRPGARVFSNTGRATEGDYAGFRGAALYLRQIERSGGTPPFAFLHYLPGRPPFTEDSETALFRELVIDQVICRDTGGPEATGKLAAARALGLDVLMIDRPAPPPGAYVTSVEDALRWEALQ